MFGIDDVAMVAGPQIISGLLQWQNSKDAQQATQQERDRIKGLIDNLKDPTFDTSMITPQDYQVVGKYVPQVASLVAEQNPTLLKGDSADATLAKSAQRDVLSNYLAQAKSGNDPLLEIQQRKAAQQASQDAQSNRASLDSLFARRGMAPGGAMQYGAALSGAADAQDKEAQAGQQAVAQAYQNRQSAMGQAAGLAGNIYNRENSQEQQNANIMNDFNKRMAQTQNQYGQYAAQQGNDAQKYNLGVSQETANANNNRNYQALVNNQTLKNNNAQQVYNNQTGKIGMQQGVANQNIAATNQNAQGTNQIYQGLGDVGSTIGSQYAKDKNKTKPYAAGSGYRAAPGGIV